VETVSALTEEDGSLRVEPQKDPGTGLIGFDPNDGGVDGHDLNQGNGRPPPAYASAKEVATAMRRILDFYEVLHGASLRLEGRHDERQWAEEAPLSDSEG